MKRLKKRTLLTNPLTLLLPVACILVVAWRHYTYVGLALSTPGSMGNLLSNGDFAQLGSDGIPTGWQLKVSGNAAYETSHSSGYVAGNTLTLHVTRYQSGDVTLSSPKITVKPQQTYLYKGYYKADKPFTFLARYYHADGTSDLVDLHTYNDGSGTWSTVSDAFKSGSDIIAVQYVYKLTAISQLQVNGVYLEPKSAVYIAPPTSGTNLIPNSQLSSASDVDMPDQWSPYSSGNNTAAFSYDTGGDGTDLEVTVSDYHDGEAKWQYQPLQVRGDQYYRFGVNYQSDAPAEVVAEYQLANGQQQFASLATLPPASDWTTVSYPIEVPPGATTMFVSLVLNANGTLATRDYSLVNATKSGPAQWKRPLVSLTFDDGWQSVYTNAEPLLKRLGLKATFYINPSSIETPGFMNAAELSNLAAESNEIAAHGYEHDDMTALDEGELSYQLREGRDYLRQAGYQADDFATPYGNSDPEVEWYARQYFQTMRSVEDGLNTRQNFNPYDLKVQYIDDDTSSSALAADLAQTKAYGGWLILVYHRVGVTITPRTLKVENTTVSTKNFSDQLNLIKQSSINVLPVTDAYQEAAQQ